MIGNVAGANLTACRMVDDAQSYAQPSFILTSGAGCSAHVVLFRVALGVVEDFLNLGRVVTMLIDVLFENRKKLEGLYVLCKVLYCCYVLST